MTNNKKQDKNLPHTKQHNPKQPDSTTEVHFLGSPRKSVSFKCNEKLWKTFVSTVKAQGLSVCHILEPMVYGWLQGKVHLSNTIKPIKIENLVVERAVKRVRRYAREVVDDGDVDEFEGVKCVFCGSPAVGYYERLGKKKVPTGEIVPLCEFHAKFDKDTKCNFKFVRGLKDERA